MNRCWIIDLESFTIRADNEEEAAEAASEYLKQVGAKIDKILPCLDYERSADTVSSIP